MAHQPEVFIAQLQEKIQNLLKDFSDGKLNKDQFNVVYSRYNSQLKLIEDAIASGLTNPVAAAQDGQQTAAIIRDRGGKFLGLRIFNNRNNMVIHTLGEFDVPPNQVMPYVENLIMMIESRQPLGRHLEKIDEKRWMLFSSGRYTISASIYKNEPSQKQTQEVYRLHRDFEEANKVFLQSGKVDPNQLAYPFMVLLNTGASLKF
ncbi:MAG: hypothetical protein U0694_13700 [Anaerolineae bacterium]